MDGGNQVRPFMGRHEMPSFCKMEAQTSTDVEHNSWPETIAIPFDCAAERAWQKGPVRTSRCRVAREENGVRRHM